MSYFTRKNLCRLLAFSIFSAIAVSAVAGDRGTPVEARAMLMKAIAHYKAVGRKQALADFTAQKPPFRDRDLYIVCVDRQRRIFGQRRLSRGRLCVCRPHKGFHWRRRGHGGMESN